LTALVLWGSKRLFLGQDVTPAKREDVATLPCRTRLSSGDAKVTRAEKGAEAISS